MPYSTISNIDFTSAKSKKRKFDCSILENTDHLPKTPKSVKKQPEIPPPTNDECASLFRSLQATGTKPVLLALVPEFANSYIPNVLGEKYPKLLTELSDESHLNSEKEVLFAHCEEVFKTVTVSSEEANNVEDATKKQSKSKDWFRFRTGRITARLRENF